MALEEAHPVHVTAVKFKIVGRQWPPFSIVLDVCSDETCADITEELLGYILDGADKPLRLHLYECWRGRGELLRDLRSITSYTPFIERRIHRDENVLELVKKWGCPGDYKLVGRLLCDDSKAKKKKSTQNICSNVLHCPSGISFCFFCHSATTIYSQTDRIEYVHQFKIQHKGTSNLIVKDNSILLSSPILDIDVGKDKRCVEETRNSEADGTGLCDAREAKDPGTSVGAT